MKLALFETLPGFGGGNVYQKHILRALQNSHEVQSFRLQRHPFFGTRLGKIMHAARVYREHPEIDLWISTYLPTIATTLSRPAGKIISLFYHLEEEIAPNPFLTLPMNRLYFRQARRCDGVVVIADYWRRFLEKQEVPVLKVIHWGFEISEFDFEQEELQAFRQKHGLLDKPVLYLGNCQRKKGVVEAYKALKTMDAHLVTSGRQEVKLPARNFVLDYRDYGKLLAASDVVLTMSKFREGWNATAHEAMLAGTPVIGSGLGGMRELLEGGGQQICRNFSGLPEAVARALDAGAEYAHQGRAYARKFTVDRFSRAWQSLIREFEQCT